MVLALPATAEGSGVGGKVGFGGGACVKSKQKIGNWLAGRNRRGIIRAKRLLWKDIKKIEGNK